MISEKDDISKEFQRIYNCYMNSNEITKYMDGIYGDGSIAFAGKAMEYNDKAPNL